MAPHPRPRERLVRRRQVLRVGPRRNGPRDLSEGKRGRMMSATYERSTMCEELETTMYNPPPENYDQATLAAYIAGYRDGLALGRGSLSYDDDAGGHVCTVHGRTMQVDRDTEPSAGGSYYYRCNVCGAGGWSGL